VNDACLAQNTFRLNKIRILKVIFTLILISIINQKVNWILKSDTGISLTPISSQAYTEDVENMAN